MKNYITLALIGISLSFSAQTNRFYYEYKFISDSTDKADVKSEMMLLDIDKNGSTYYSRERFVADSTMQAEVAKQIKASTGNISINRRQKAGEVAYKVIKHYPDYKTFLFTNIAMDKYKIAEDTKPEWKILPEKQKIGEYNAQKATTNFGGRKWTAWFSTEIPFQDGPYKFYGLPGLIVKIEDQSSSHVMTLKANKKINVVANSDLEVPDGIKMVGLGEKEIEISEKQFKKVWKDYVNDPTKNMREMMMKNSGDSNNKVVFRSRTADGREITDPNQVFRDIEKRTKEGLKKNNNPIEPDLY